MTINKFWISSAIGGQDGFWWEALFNLIAVTFLVSSIVYFLPYQVKIVFTLISTLKIHTVNRWIVATSTEVVFSRPSGGSRA